MKKNYIDKKIYGLPTMSRKGHNTRFKHKMSPYIHKVNINGYIYYKVHLERNKISKIKYFKNKRQAEIFTDLLSINSYL